MFDFLPDLSSAAKRRWFAGLVLAGGLAAFVFTAFVIPWISAFAAAVLKAGILIALWEAFDEVMLDQFDTVEELKDGNVAVAIVLVALAILLAPAIASAQTCPHPNRADLQQPELHEVAERHVGVTENPPNSNEGKMVERYLASVGLGGGYPWCAAFVHYVMQQAGVEPPVHSAGATDYITDRSIDATDVLRGTEKVPDNSLNVFRRGNTWKGHIGVVKSWDGRCGTAIEGNTSPGEGSQWDGGGVAEKDRCIQPGNYFRVVAFTPTG